MDKELLNKLIYISEKGKFIDKQLIKDFILDEILKSDDITKNRFSDVWFSKTDIKDSVSTADSEKGLITIDYGRCLDEAYTYSSDYNFDRLVGNLRILFCIFHEVEHLKEVYKIKKEDIESTILKLCSFLALEKNVEQNLKLIKPLTPENIYVSLKSMMFNRLYNKTYYLDPAERIANIESYKYLLNGLYSYNEKDIESIKKIFKYELINEYNANYTNNETYSPTINYIVRINNNNSLNSDVGLKKEFNKFKKCLYYIEILNSEEKMKLGLPIKIEKRKELVKELKTKNMW